LRQLTVLEPELEELERLPVSLQRLVRDLELRIETAQLQIRARHLSDQREDQAASRLLGREDIGARCLGLPADASPEIDLPARARQNLIRILRIGDESLGEGSEVDLARALPRCAAAVADLREELRARLHQQGRSL